jgi:hypothetical protein
MSFESKVVSNPALAESGKFVRLENDSRFPAISVTRVSPYDDSNAFPQNTNRAPLTSVEIYPKYGVITYLANASDIVVSLSSSNLDIGDVGFVDHYTTGSPVHGSIIYTNTVTNGALSYDMGAVSVKPYGTTSVDGTVRITNTTAVSGNVTITNPISDITARITNTAAISTTQTLPVSVVNPQIEIANDVNNPIPVNTTQTLPVSGSVTVTNSISTTPTGTQNVIFADSVQLDQASRLRVSGLQNQWWYTSSVDKDGDVRYNEKFTNEATPTFVHGASSRFVQNLGSVNLTSGLSATGSTIRGSRRRHKVIPGLSHEYTGTWNFDGSQINVIKRMGIFTNFNGYFFELDGYNFNVVVRRRLPDGTLVEERVERANWNGDKLDGSGTGGENWGALTTIAAITGYVSTIPINIGNTTVYNVTYQLSAGQASQFRQGTKATFSGIIPVTYNQVGTIIATDTTTGRLTANYIINPGTYSSLVVSPSGMVQTAYHMQHSYWIDFLGGRTNRVRFGKASDYGNIILHTFRFDGLLGTAYENAPALMERKEIVNVGPVTGTPSFTIMGNSFNIEAEATLSPNFVIAHHDTGVSFADNRGGIEFPILGVALRTGEPFQRADLQIQSINILDIANAGAAGNKAIQYGTFGWRLVLNPALSGVPAPKEIGKASRHWEYTTSSKLTGGGIELVGGLFVSNTTNEVKTSLNFLNMGSNIDYTESDVVVLMVRQLGTAASNAPVVVAEMNMIEAI